MSEHRVSVDNGKYTFVLRPTDSKVDVLRDGKPWVTILRPWNALHSALCELDAARVVLEAAFALGDDAPLEIKRAIERFRSLVGSSLPPSDWTK